MLKPIPSESTTTKLSSRSAVLLGAFPLAMMMGCVGDQSIGEDGPPPVVSESKLETSSLLPPVPILGAVDHFGFVVHDVARATAEFTAATGTQFQPKTTNTQIVGIIGDRELPKVVTLTEAFSRTEKPFIDFVQASDAIGPWDRDASRPYLSYSVPHPNDPRLSTQLRNAGFKRVAIAADFVFWETTSGVLVRLLRSSAAPQPTAGPETLPLGNAAVMSISPCDPEGLQAQLSAGLNLTWPAGGTIPFTFPWTDENGVFDYANLEASGSAEGPPLLAFEYQRGPVKKLMYQCTATQTQAHIAYVSTDVPAVDQRWANAGLRNTARIIDLITYYRTADNLNIEAADASLFAAGE